MAYYSDEERILNMMMIYFEILRNVSQISNKYPRGLKTKQIIIWHNLEISCIYIEKTCPEK